MPRARSNGWKALFMPITLLPTRRPREAKNHYFAAALVPQQHELLLAGPGRSLELVEKDSVADPVAAVVGAVPDHHVLAAGGKDPPGHGLHGAPRYVEDPDLDLLGLREPEGDPGLAGARGIRGAQV